MASVTWNCLFLLIFQKAVNRKRNFVDGKSFDKDVAMISLQCSGSILGRGDQGEHEPKPRLAHGTGPGFVWWQKNVAPSGRPVSGGNKAVRSLLKLKAVCVRWATWGYTCLQSVQV